jgi:hypothetical protein
MKNPLEAVSQPGLKGRGFSRALNLLEAVGLCRLRKNSLCRQSSTAL